MLTLDAEQSTGPADIVIRRTSLPYRLEEFEELHFRQDCHPTELPHIKR
jgi:hypothetical protein